MIDLHIHSSFSDGIFAPKTIIEAAIRSELTEIGISDHYWTTKTQSVSSAKLDQYLDTLDRLHDEFGSQIIIRKALEIDLNSVFLNGTELPPPSALRRLDYVLFEYVSGLPMNGIPLKHAIELRNTIDLPVGLAHTDLIQSFPHTPLPELLSVLAESGIFLECNDAYQRIQETIPYYQHLQNHIDSVRQSGISLSCGSDMHDDLDELGAERANTWLALNSLKSQLVKLG